MKPVSRFLRAILLAWSLLLTTQVALVHGYAHMQLAASQAGNASRGSGETEKAQHGQLCTLCLTLSQLSTALPSHNHLLMAAISAPGFYADAFASVPAARARARLARGPPVHA